MVSMRAVSVALVLLIGLSPGLRAGDRRAGEADHWAWKPPVRPAVPQPRDSSWVVNPIDAFILSRLEAEGLRPAAPAGREALLRRVTFDLTGLPPTVEEMDAFLADDSPEAWEKVVDRLLASPRHGERWARHWLDLARYADTNGYELDEPRPDAWRYRDYVIRSLNEDKPYDRFVSEQIAGDILHPGDPDALIATGFNLLGPDMTDAADQATRRLNSLHDMTETAALVFLGLTVGCARCHDHKFEPIPQRDFFRLEAFFTSAAFRRDLVIAGDEEKAFHEKALGEYRALTKDFEEEIARIEKKHIDAIRARKLRGLADEARAAHETPLERRTDLQKELAEKTERLLGVSPGEVTAALSPEERERRDRLQVEIRGFAPRKPRPLPTAMGLAEGRARPIAFVLDRGEPGHHLEEVAPGFPVAVAAPEPPRDAPPSPGARADLARWIASASNPLAARVMANRVWQHHLGRGIVATPSDFGRRGERPTHPELLDWLARELIDGGWSLKRLHRTILLSSTYRQSAAASPEAQRVDPENRFLSHASRVRLEAEAVRDALLAASGLLDGTLGGPGVFPPIPAEALEGAAGWKAGPPASGRRRSLYIFARRNLRFPLLETFDLPDSNLSCPERGRSTTATQALSLLNSDDVSEASRALASRLEAASPDAAERVRLAFRLTIGRRPTAAELEMSRDFLERSPLAELCRALFNANEFVYVD